MGPWDPNWRPDPTGRRLVAIRAARRGALAAAVIFGSLEVVAAVVAIPADSRMAPNALLLGLTVALVSLPAIALLGAGLTSAALGTPSSAASAGLAMGVGVPVAAVSSAMIGAFIIAGVIGTSHGGTGSGQADGADLAGILLRVGVTAAVRIAPLIALASVAWVLVVRRSGRPMLMTGGVGEGRSLSWLRRGRGPRRRDG
jgi:hypothetical protein